MKLTEGRKRTAPPLPPRQVREPTSQSSSSSSSSFYHHASSSLPSVATLLLLLLCTWTRNVTAFVSPSSNIVRNTLSLSSSRTLFQDGNHRRRRKSNNNNNNNGLYLVSPVEDEFVDANNEDPDDDDSSRRGQTNQGNGKPPRRQEQQQQPSTTTGNRQNDRPSSSMSKPFVNAATIQFNNKLNKMARQACDNPNMAQQVEDLLRKVLKDIPMGLELEIQPNVITFTAAISAWAKSTHHHKDAPERAEAMLRLLLKYSASSSSSGGVIAKESYDDDDDNNVDDDDDLYHDLVLKPNVIAYNAAITAWIRAKGYHKNAHRQAERLMQELWDSYQATQDPDLKPTERTFNMVINAIARSREPGCADRAAALLHQMEELYLAGDDDMEPNALTFGAIINAYANAGDSADKAAQILQEMESLYQLGYQGVKPNTFVYNACLNAFAKSKNHPETTATKNNDNGDSAATLTDAQEKANQLLELMENQYYKKGDASVKPDVITYSTCINVHANSKTTQAGIQADRILRRMTELYLYEGDDSVKPNAITYTANIKAWLAAAKAGSKQTSSSPEVVVSYKTASERAEALLQLMTMQYLAGDVDQKPTRVTFELVSKAMSDAGDTEGVARTETLRKRILAPPKHPRQESI